MQRSIFLGGLLALSALIASGQAVVDGFSLDQISFASTSTGNVPCSEYGRAGFAVRQIPGLTQYVQVVAQMAGSTTAPAWIVQNVPAVASILAETTPVNLTQLGIQRGTCIDGSKVTYSVTVTDNLIATSPGVTGSATAFVGRRTQKTEGMQVTNAGLPSLPPAESTPVIALALRAVAADAIPNLGDLGAQFIDRPGMGNIIQNTNECAPAAIANSMQWLQSKGAIDLKGETPQQTMSKLKADVSWTVAEGSKPADMLAGKLKFAQRAEHPLDLEIHYQTISPVSQVGDSVTSGTGIAKRDGPDAPPTSDYIKREMQKGQDVEISLR